MNDVNPAGFDMRNAMPIEDVGCWPDAIEGKDASERGGVRTWGAMIVSDREAQMWRDEFGPVAAVRWSAGRYDAPYIQPLTFARYVTAGIKAAHWNGSELRPGAIY